MLPEHRLSTVDQTAPFLFPDNLPNSYRVDFSYGGVGLSDPSAGIRFQVWRCLLEIDEDNVGSVYVNSSSVSKILLFIRANVTEISLAFDQNMKPFVGFLQSGTGGFWWWDPVVNEQVFTMLPAGSSCPKATLDDKRDIGVNTSDILIFYVRSNNLYFREQRDRYQVEYLLKTGVIGTVLKAGMGVNNRIQVALGVSL